MSLNRNGDKEFPRGKTCLKVEGRIQNWRPKTLFLGEFSKQEITKKEISIIETNKRGNPRFNWS